MEYISEGIVNEEFKNQARMQNFQTVSQVIQAFKTIKFNDIRPRRRPIICYACNQPGHVAVNCFRRIKKTNTFDERQINQESQTGRMFHGVASIDTLTKESDNNFKTQTFTDIVKEEGHNGLVDS